MDRDADMRIANHLELVVNAKMPLSFCRVDRLELFLVCVGCLHILQAAEICVLTKISALERVSSCWSMLSALLVWMWMLRCRCAAPKKISLVNEVLVGLEWRGLIGQQFPFQEE